MYLRSVCSAEEMSSEFEKRGVTIGLLRSVRDHALQKNSEDGYWSIGRLSALLIGNHEILRKDCRWGNVDPAEVCIMLHFTSHHITSHHITSHHVVAIRHLPMATNVH